MTVTTHNVVTTSRDSFKHVTRYHHHHTKMATRSFDQQFTATITAATIPDQTISNATARYAIVGVILAIILALAAATVTLVWKARAMRGTDAPRPTQPPAVAVNNRFRDLGLIPPTTPPSTAIPMYRTRRQQGYARAQPIRWSSDGMDGHAQV